MMIGKFESCDVRRIIEQRFKWKPKRVEEWFSQTDFALNAVSSQSLTYFWDFQSELPANVPPSSSLSSPMFFGTVDYIVSNPGIGVSAANSYVIINRFFVENINFSGPFYNMYSQQLRRYGVGSYGGSTFPASFISEYYSSGVAGNVMLTPLMSVEVFTDVTGVVFMDVYASFTGFKITMV